MPKRRRRGIESGDASVKAIKPVQRNAANARERSRMRVLSKAFSKLKTTLPWVPPDTKLSKLDTLRLASSYIAHLGEMLENETDDVIKSSRVHPINLTWPFSFSGRFADSLPNCDDHLMKNGDERNVKRRDDEQKISHCVENCHLSLTTENLLF